MPPPSTPSGSPLGLPPLSRLRKGAALLVLLLVVFAISRFVLWLTPQEIPQEAWVAPANTIICHNVADSRPLGIDSVFRHGGFRVYAYSHWDAPLFSSDSLWHVWYQGGQAVQTSYCATAGKLCFTSMAPESLSVGHWSVDLVQDGRLLSTRQFTVTPE
jgi:hypothetical protein